MKSLSSFLLIALAGTAAAETVIQPTDFSVNNDGGLYNGTDNKVLAAPGFFRANCQPFNAALGTLTSFSVDWQIGGFLSGTIGNEGESGNASGSLGGTFSINAVAFGGTGTGNGGGGAGGEPVEVGFAIPAFHHEFKVENAGVNYDPRILQAVTGSTPFPVDYDSAVTVNFANVVDLSASVEGTLTLTYTYETSAGTESLKIVSLVRNGSQETVSIEWTSAAGKTYAIDVSSDLTANSWTEIQAGLPALNASPTTTFVEENVPATIQRRFYRVREEE